MDFPSIFLLRSRLKCNSYLLGYDDFLSLKIKLAVTFSLILFLAVWSKRVRNLSHWNGWMFVFSWMDVKYERNILQNPAEKFTFLIPYTIKTQSMLAPNQISKWSEVKLGPIKRIILSIVDKVWPKIELTGHSPSICDTVCGVGSWSPSWWRGCGASPGRWATPRGGCGRGRWATWPPATSCSASGWWWPPTPASGAPWAPWCGSCPSSASSKCRSRSETPAAGSSSCAPSSPGKPSGWWWRARPPGPSATPPAGWGRSQTGWRSLSVRRSILGHWWEAREGDKLLPENVDSNVINSQRCTALKRHVVSCQWCKFELWFDFNVIYSGCSRFKDMSGQRTISNAQFHRIQRNKINQTKVKEY